MNVLLVSPKCPDSFWGFTHALKFISKMAAVPPLGLITASAILPTKWEKKLLDLNISPLHIKDVQWADYIFISAIYIQRESVDEIIAICKKSNKKIVADGPLFTQEYEKYPFTFSVQSSMNFVPTMNPNDLKEGYKKIIENIYSIKPYYKRVRQLLLLYKNRKKGQKKITFSGKATPTSATYTIEIFRKLYNNKQKITAFHTMSI